ncbi:MAG: transglutaminase domain-containing protein [Lachnospiraceae bacterium]|nr:transglutaminase domain-containing protein [Lachnospiraceae bacterium]
MICKKMMARVVLVVMVLCMLDLRGLTTLEVEAAEDKVSVIYQAHCQTFSWFPAVKDGQEAGITGYGKRMECLRIKLDSNIPGGIEYQVHCQKYGWLDWVSNGKNAGTVNESKRLEAIRIRLTGKIATKYDVYYRTHCQTYGWLPWVKNGEMSGTEKQAKRLEAIEIKLVKKGGSVDANNNSQLTSSINLTYKTHVQKYGWLNYVSNNTISGTVNESKRLEAIKINLQSSLKGGITYRVHSQSYGWLPWVENDEEAGITGLGKRMEAIQIYLKGDIAKKYDIYYRVHVQTYGWLDWAKNGGYAGSTNYSKRLEAIQIIIKQKNTPAPGKTTRPFVCPGKIPEPAVPEGVFPDDSSNNDNGQNKDNQNKNDQNNDNQNKDDQNKNDQNKDDQNKTTPVPKETYDESGRPIEQILNSAKLDYYAKTGDSKVDARVKTILDSIIKPNMSTYEKTKAIYDWIINNNSYPSGYEAPWGGNRWSFSTKYDLWCFKQSYSCLFTGKGSCKNYAAAFVVLTRAIGLNSYKVCGHAPGSSVHGWAVIVIDGKYYHFDPQLGDIKDGGGFGNTYDFFGKTNSQFIKMGFDLCGDGDGTFQDYINGFKCFK